jgi:SAM-dependent methyltransferase
MMLVRSRDFYDNSFFDAQVAGALGSARVVAPLVYDLVHPRRVVDVGCGRGAWLRAFYEIGADFIQGLDGDYVDRDTLLIPSESFVAADLAKLTKLPGDYDLAICLEVLEHLSAQAGRNIVAALIEAAPVVLFSAAVPGQGGTNHVNEQWPEYWRRLFEARGYRMLDPIRPRIREDKRVACWYRQNLFLFGSKAWLESRPMRQPDADGTGDLDDNWVHATLYRRVVTEPGVKELLGRLPSAMRRSIARRLKKGLG